MFFILKCLTEILKIFFYRMEVISPEGLRNDGRTPTCLREIKCRLGLYDRPNGSAYIEMGNTKVLAAVYGPREVW